MTAFVIYELADGSIFGFGNCPEEAISVQVVPEGKAILTVDEIPDPDPDTHYILGDQIVEIDRRPSRFHVIVNGKWVLPEDIALSVTKLGIPPLLANTDWYAMRHRDQLDMGEPTTLTPEQWSELLAYRSALRAWPASGDYNEPFPTKPNWL